MLRRAMKAALLNRATFREVAEDPNAALHSAGLVFLTGLSLGLGLLVVPQEGAEVPVQVSGALPKLIGVWLSTVTIMVGWVIWAGISYVVGKKFLGGGATYRQVLRALGICHGPGVSLVLVQEPGIGIPVAMAGLVWILAASVVAVHEIQETDWLTAISPTMPGWFLSLWLMPSFLLVPMLEAL